MCRARPTLPSGRTPAAALEAQRAGQIAMMPPTLSILLELLDLGSVASVRQAAADRVIERVLPELIETTDGWQFRYPSPAAIMTTTRLSPYLRAGPRPEPRADDPGGHQHLDPG